MTQTAGPTPVPPAASAPQLDGVIATQSSICLLSAGENRLAYRGYDVAELAEQGSFEETAYLLLAGRLPRRDELTRLVWELRARYKVPPRILRLLRSAPPQGDSMAWLRTAVSALGAEPIQPTVIPEIPPAALSLIAVMPALVAALHRIGRGERPITPRRGLGLAANLLYMLHGQEPGKELARSFDVALSLRADNELNPSTFAARVTAATGADLHGCVTAAIAALAGPLHGGHALSVHRLLEEIGRADRLAAVVDARLARGNGFPGFGHPVYREEDPRTAPMRRAAESAVASTGERGWLDLAEGVDARVRAATGRYPNVDFYLTPLYRALEVPPEVFGPVFALARMPGWLAHVLEQQSQEGLIRPRAGYVGPRRQEYVSLRARR